MGKEVLCIIPARGGSKGITRKNIVSVAGKPLIYYSISAALGSESVSRVVVSTEDDEGQGVLLGPRFHDGPGTLCFGESALFQAPPSELHGRFERAVSPELGLRHEQAFRHLR